MGSEVFPENSTIELFRIIFAILPNGHLIHIPPMEMFDPEIIFKISHEQAAMVNLIRQTLAQSKVLVIVHPSFARFY